MNTLDTLLPRMKQGNCPNCDYDSAPISMKVESFLYGSGKDQVALRANVEVLSCPSCKEEFALGDSDGAKHDAICQHLGRMNPREIRAIRGLYGMSQDEFAKATGLGLASIKRWECGAQIPNQSSDNLLRLLAFNENMDRLQRQPVRPPARQLKGCFRTEISEDMRERQRHFKLRASQCEALAS